MVLFFVDDLAYGDLGATGAPGIRTPNIDRLAKEGRRLTGWYSAASICSPSRASLMTGRHFVRTGVYPGALNCNAETGMHLEELTLGEVMKGAGYRTQMLGKWHLGQRPDYLPHNRGFDHYLGVPYSVDQGSLKDHNCKQKDCPYLPLLRDGEILEQPVNPETLTEKYVEEAKGFIENSVASGDPFLLVYASSHVHVSVPGKPQYAGKAFQGSQRRGRFGDAVAETDWALGELMNKLDSLGVGDDALIVMTSDNGPWMAKETDCGSPGPFRGLWALLNGGYWDTGKGSTWEGGYRMPAFARWPGIIPPGSTSQQPLSTLDILPTFARIGGASLPQGIVLDGHDITHVLEHGDGEQGEREVWADGMPIWRQKDPMEIGALRMGRFKLHFLTQSGFGEDPVVAHDPPLVFDVDEDPAEQFPLDPEDPEISQLLEEGAARRLELNATIARRPPAQKGGFRKYALCNQPVFDDCFNTGPQGQEPLEL